MEDKTEITFESIIESLDNKEMREKLFAKLLASEQMDEAVEGVKLFLENNNYDHIKLKEFLESSEKKLIGIVPTKNEHKRFIIRPWLAIAAGLAFLLSIGTYLIFFNNSDNQLLYAKYYESETGLPVLMQTNDNKLFDESMNAFKDGAFEEANNGFIELLANRQTNDTLNYFSACSEMELQNYKSSIAKFNLVSGSSVFKEKAEYRLVLVYLQINELEKARELLKKIKNQPDHLYQQKGVEILNEEVFK